MIQNNNEILEELKKKEAFLGFNPLEIKQGEPEWFKMKLGVISASNAWKVVAKGRGGKPSQTRTSYMNELIAQICTGQIHQISAKALDWGNENEEKLREAYRFFTGNTITEVPFIYGDPLLRVGCSPDALTEHSGFEIKCPWNTQNHTEFITSSEIKKEYIYQVQFSMWITGRNAWDFGSYDPRMKVKPLAIETIYRDDSIINLFSTEVPCFIAEMDEKLKKIGVEYGDQWRDDA